MNRFESLYGLLKAGDDSGTRLQQALSSVESDMLNLYSIPKKNQAERDTIKRDHLFYYTPTNARLEIDDALAQDTFTLSDHLDASEFFCASLISFAMLEKPSNITGRADNGLILHLTERDYLIAFLLELFRLVTAGPSVDGVAPATHAALERVVRNLVEQPNWIHDVFETLFKLSTEIENIKKKLQEPLAGSAPAGNNNVIASPNQSDDMLKLQLAHYQSQRAAFGRLAIHLGEMRIVQPELLTQLIRRLQAATTIDDESLCLFAALLSRLQTFDFDAGVLTQNELDDAFVTSVTQLLVPRQTTFALPLFQAALLFQWALFLDSYYRFHPQLVGTQTFAASMPEKLLSMAIEEDAFEFLGRAVIAPFHTDPAQELAQMWHSVARPSLVRDYVHAARRPLFLAQTTKHTIVAIIVGAFTHFISEKSTTTLRRQRSREEDAAASPDRTRHVEAFFLALASAFFYDSDAKRDTLRNDQISSFKFFQKEDYPKLYTFIEWAAASSHPAIRQAFYEMLSAFARHDTDTANAIITRMAENDLTDSTNALSFSVFRQYTNADYTLFTTRHPDEIVAYLQPELNQSDFGSHINYIKLLGNLAKYCDVVTFDGLHDWINLGQMQTMQNSSQNPAQQQQLYPYQQQQQQQQQQTGQQVLSFVDTLGALLVLHIPADYKAATMCALASFARVDSSVGPLLGTTLLGILDHGQLLPSRDYVLKSVDYVPDHIQHLQNPQSGIQPVMPRDTIVADLYTIEIGDKIFSQSLAFLKLLTAVVEVSKAENIAIDFTPYVDFVLYDILGGMMARNTFQMPESWPLIEEALLFVEASVSLYDLDRIVASLDSLTTDKKDDLVYKVEMLLRSPPVYIVLHILTEGNVFLNQAKTVLASANDGVYEHRAPLELFSSILSRTLNIINKVFELETAFNNVVIPKLIALGDEALVKSAIYQHVQKCSNKLTPVESIFLYDPNLLLQIMLIVRLVGAVPDTESLVLSSLTTLSCISDSALFSHRLLSLLSYFDREFKDIILQGYMVILYTPVFSREVDSPLMRIKLKLMDILLKHSAPGVFSAPTPTIAHYILGFNTDHASPSDLTIENPYHLETKQIPFHVIVKLLLDSLPDDDHIAPVLLAKFYLLIQQLTVQSYTAKGVSHFLRYDIEFFTKQIQRLPLDVSLFHEVSVPQQIDHLVQGNLVFDDEAQQPTIATSSATALNVLLASSRLMKSIAMEINALHATKDSRRLKLMVDALLIPSTTSMSASSYQVTPRVVELFKYFTFKWEDSLAANVASFGDFSEEIQTSFPGLTLNKYLVSIDGDYNTSLQMYDLVEIDSWLDGEIGTILNTSSPDETDKLQEKLAISKGKLLSALAVDNNQRLIEHGRLEMSQSWLLVLGVALITGFDTLPAETRTSLLVEVLGAILPVVARCCNGDGVIEIAEGLSITCVKLASLSRKDLMDDTKSGHRGPPSSGISFTDIHRLLDMIFNIISLPSSTLPIRTNLYAVIDHLLDYGRSSAELFGNQRDGDQDLNEAIEEERPRRSKSLHRSSSRSALSASFSDRRFDTPTPGNSFTTPRAPRTMHRAGPLLSTTARTPGAPSSTPYGKYQEPISTPYTSRRNGHPTPARKYQAQGDATFYEELYAVMLSHSEKVIYAICEDALVGIRPDGTGNELERMLAFTTLTTFVAVFERANNLSVFINLLIQGGYLKLFVLNMKSFEGVLLRVVSHGSQREGNGLYDASDAAYYVFETQVLFFIQLAVAASANSIGAEALLDLGLLNIVNSSTFLSAKPLISDEDTANHGYVTAASETYNNILVLVLRLNVAVLTSYGIHMTPSLITMRSLVELQRDTFIETLRECAAGKVVSLSSIVQSCLIVNILSDLLPTLSDEEVRVLSRFGALHQSVMGLVETLFNKGNHVLWYNRIKPTTESEGSNDATIVPYDINKTKQISQFTADVNLSIQLLERALLKYQIVATDGYGRDSSSNVIDKKKLHHHKLTLVPSLSPEQHQNNGAATLGSLSQFLKDSIENLPILLDQYQLSREASSLRSTENLALARRLRKHYYDSILLTLEFIEMSFVVYFRNVALYHERLSNVPTANGLGGRVYSHIEIIEFHNAIFGDLEQLDSLVEESIKWETVENVIGRASTSSRRNVIDIASKNTAVILLQIKQFTF